MEVVSTVVINLQNQDDQAWARCDGREQVYIGRGSPWGNPFTHLPLGRTTAQARVASRERAIQEYERWILERPELMARLPELRDVILVCHCRPLPCHGDTLVKLVESL